MFLKVLKEVLLGLPIAELNMKKGNTSKTEAKIERKDRIRIHEICMNM